MVVKRRLKGQKSEQSSLPTVREDNSSQTRVVKMRTLDAHMPAVSESFADACPPDLNPGSLQVPKDPVKGVVCGHCSTEVLFAANACPICGTPLDSHDNGLVRLFSDMEFEDDCSGEVVCPFCGETVILQEGTCPSCLEVVHECVGAEPSQKVEPVVHGENVVYVHLDVEHGELDCIQRTPHRLGLEHLTVKLENGGE